MYEFFTTLNISRSFLYPTDLQLDLDYWTETGEYDADELHEVRIYFTFLFCYSKPYLYIGAVDKTVSEKNYGKKDYEVTRQRIQCTDDLCRRASI